MTEQQIFLLGPQVTNWTREALERLQQRLLEEHDLKFISQALLTLPSLSSVLGQQLGLDFHPGRSFHLLADFAQGGQLLLESNDWRHNTLLAPLTIVSQAVDLTIQFKGRPADEPPLQPHQQVQGFCIGWLSASSLASASTWPDFERNISAALRLGACIGAAVDADSSQCPSDHATAICVRLRNSSDRAFLETLLDQIPGAYISCFLDETVLTVTVPNSKRLWLEEQLQRATLPWTDIGLYGHYHHPRHEERAQTLKRICASIGELQLATAADLQSPLRSTADADIVPPDSTSLHDIAIDLTLCKRAHWLQTLRNCVEKAEDFCFIPIGSQGGLVPRSITHPRLSPSMRSPNHNLMPKDEIAIIGMSARFPGSDSLSDFWNLLVSGRTAFGPLPVSRFDSTHPSIASRLAEAKYQGNFLRDEIVKGFDHRFFDISGREAKRMDPQQRLVLEVAYEALATAGYHQMQSQDKQTEVGVYMGVGEVEYQHNLAGHEATPFTAVGLLRSFISGRALLAGECELALAGGVNVITSPELHQALAAGSFLNPNGSSHAFDASAAGYCRGEGAGILVLKPLSKAVADGDAILGVIGASAVNQNSNCSPITIPESSSQCALYQKVLESAGVSPGEVTYVEAHGTGTQVGDPKEYESIRMALCGPFRKEELFVGSAKDTIGHCEAASGVAGLIKTLLMMHHKTIPPQAGFDILNPRIMTTPADRITIPKVSQPWNPAHRRVALVNNYGAAGSNAAILVREYNEPAPLSPPSAPTSYPVLLSAKTAVHLRFMIDALKAWRPLTASFGDIAHNINKSQNPRFLYRLALTASNHDEMVARLDTLAASSIISPITRLPVVLAFGGQTGQCVSFSEHLYNTSPLLRKHLADCNNICISLSLPPVLPHIFSSSESLAASKDIVRQHCQLLALQVSTARCWLESGLEASDITLVGHSFGQISALVVAGSLTLEDGFRFVAGRARLIRDHWSTHSDTGCMLSVECPESQAREIRDVANKSLQESDRRVEIACYNGPTSFVLSGHQEAITQAKYLCQQRGIKCLQLASTHAYHSHMTEPILAKLTELSKSLALKPPRLRIETCTRKGADWQFTAGNLVQHTREPVFFSDAIARITASNPQGAIWLEAGSSSPVIPMIKQIKRIVNKSGGKSADLYLAAGLRDDHALTNLCAMTSQLWQAGCSVQYWPFLQHGSPKRHVFVPVPPYQFDKKQHWLDYKPRGLWQSGTTAEPKASSEDLITLVEADDTGKHTFEVNKNAAIYQLATKGHAVTGHPLCPASLYLELVARCVQVAANMSPDDPNVPHFEALAMSSPLGAGMAQTKTVVSLHQDATKSWSFDISSMNTEGTPTEHARGRVALSSPQTDAQLSAMSKMFRRSRVDRLDGMDSSSKVAGPMVYQVFSNVVDYAPYYQGVRCLTAHGDEALGLVGSPISETPDGLQKGICDPVALDNFLQVAGIHVNCLRPKDAGQVFMCTAVEEIMISPAYRHPSAGWKVYTRYDAAPGSVEMINDILVYDGTSNQLVVAIMGATFRGVSLKSLERTLSRLNGTSRVVAVTTPPRQSPPPTEPIQSVQAVSTPITRTHPAQIDHVVEALEMGYRAQPSAGHDINRMLSSIIEMPSDEITPTSTLSELGIDSLLASDVLAEITNLFGVKVSQPELLACSNVADLVGLVERQSTEPTSSSVAPKVSRHDSFETTDSDPLASSGLFDSEMGSNDSSCPTEFTDEDMAPSFESGHSHMKKNGEMEDQRGTAQITFSEATANYTQHASDTRFSNFCMDAYPTQSRLVTQYVVEAFQHLGCDLALMRPGSEITSIGSFDARHSKLVTQLYRILDDSKLISRDGLGKFRRTDTPVDTTSALDLHATMLSRFPQHTSETKLLHATASRLAACLTGAADPIAILFGTAPARALLEDVYLNAPMFRTGTLVLIDYLSSIVRTSSRRTIRILEIGAGTGGTTRPLLESLSQIERPGITVEYTFTDLSPSLVAAAKRKFAPLVASNARKNGVKIEMQFITLDIESPDAKQDKHYDIILSTNCIHATKNLAISASHIRELLDPVEGGQLCLVELTRNLYWFDLVFGLLEGWWRFDDGRTHALADELTWEKDLKQAGFASVEWSDDGTQEGAILRVITAHASPHQALNAREDVRMETMCFKSVDGVDLMADIYYPATSSAISAAPRPIALMIHGGGHIMLSRADIRPAQTELLLSKGFLPVSIDYRLCPETTLQEGPMEDTASALSWVRKTLPTLSLARQDIQVDGEKVVAIGWSTGGLLAMSLSWKSGELDVRPPEAILVFYSPSDYQDPFWTLPNIPEGSESVFPIAADSAFATFDQPITAYNPPSSAVGGWMSVLDPRSRLALYMNHQGKTLEVLLRGVSAISGKEVVHEEEVAAVSPLAQVQQNRYKTPTFIIHPRQDDLIPWQQAQRMHEALQQQGVDAELRIVDGGAKHLFDVGKRWESRYPQGSEAVREGYEFLQRHVNGMERGESA
ncbi:putative polyketide synthase [Cercophora samala]|uniref:Polyketide synthase n=1 Tax=Cercophora samala TaxID=330535 RepID=A0AA40DC58_9PEZI|nr:putative polyketide synthase [Cercophora samala]